MGLATATALTTGIRNHDGTDDAPFTAAPAGIGTVRSVSTTHMPRGGLGARIAAWSTPWFTSGGGVLYFGRASTTGIAIAATFCAFGVLAAALVIAHRAIITTHFYDPRDLGKDEPRWLALRFRFQARGGGAKVRLGFDGRADDREPGRPDDDDPETLRHLSCRHPYWFARAADDAWRAPSRAAADWRAAAVRGTTSSGAAGPPRDPGRRDHRRRIGRTARTSRGRGRTGSSCR